MDDFVSIKSLELLKSVKSGVYLYLFSDNKAKNKLAGSFIKDFIKETGNVIITRPTYGKFHDRFIVIDYATENEIIYHCGASSKDAGNRITTIMRIDNIFDYKKLFDDALNS